MNNYIKHKLPFFALASAMTLGVATFSSCDDDDNSDSTPVVNYIRPTDANVADSLMERVSMGQTIAVMGSGFEDVNQILFNDQKALVVPTYITSNCIIVTVPTTSWTIQNDSLTLITRGGQRTQYYLPVNKTLPKITGISNEYPEAGEEVTITGNSFFSDEDMLSLVLPGVGEVEITEATETSLKFVLPEGVGKGNIVVNSLYGSGKSGFVLYDDGSDGKTAMMLDFESAFNGWGKTQVVNENGNNIAHFSGSTALRGWNEKGTILCSFKTENYSFKMPEGDNLALKFQFRCNNTWSLVAFYIEPMEIDEETNNAFDAHPGYCWEPWQNGAYGPTGWQTISIPLSAFNQTTYGKVSDKGSFDFSKLGGFKVFVRGGTGTDDKTEQELDMDVDNFRIGPM
jgi:hypothetical protein